MPAETRKDGNEKSGEVDIMKIGEKDANLPSPIDLNFRISKEVELPSLKWKNADEIPQLMKISNSGHSAIVTAKWCGPYRPYITGGQLRGMYIFSQAHFHWGANDQEGSEHTIEGLSQPLELHVMYFKTEYDNPDTAKQHLDGIVVLTYLFNLRKKANTNLVPVVEALPSIVKPYTSTPLQLMPISKLTPVFTDDYFLYWGRVLSTDNYQIMWIVHRHAQPVSAEQLAPFRMLMGENKERLIRNFRDTKSVNGRTILFVNPGSVRDTTLVEAEPDPVEESPDMPEEGTKSTKNKNSAPHLKSGKRKSSARRQSKKATEKLHKSDAEGAFYSDRDLHAALAVTESSNGSDTSSPSELSVSNTSQSQTSEEESSPNSSRYDLKGMTKGDLAEFSQEELPVADITELLARSNISNRCDDLLERLHANSVAKSNVCLEILDNLERMVSENISRKARKPNSAVDTSDESGEENSQKTVEEKLPPKNLYEILPTVKDLPIKLTKCPEMQFAMVHAVPQPNRQQIVKLTIGDDSQKGKTYPAPPMLSPVKRQPPKPPVVSKIPLSLSERIRRANRRRSDQSVSGSSESTADKDHFLGELMNNTMLTAVWKKVTSPSGMVMNETLALVTSQTSEDNIDRKNVSYLQQNAFMEIEPKSAKGKFQGHKVQKLKRKGSGAFPLGGGLIGRGKRQTTVMKMFVDEVTTNQTVKGQSGKTKSHPNPEFNIKAPLGQQRRMAPSRLQSPSRKPAWKY